METQNKQEIYSAKGIKEKIKWNINEMITLITKEKNITLINIEETSDKDCVSQFSIRIIWGKPF